MCGEKTSMLDDKLVQNWNRKGEIVQWGTAKWWATKQAYSKVLSG
jgi:hypothetical protein